MLLYRPAPAARGRGPDLDCRPPSDNAPPPSVLRVATYNIQGNSCDLEQIARDLESVDADIVGLQEVHNSFRRPRQLTWLARRLGMAAVHVPVRRWCGRYHRNNGLLTQLPIGDWQRFPLGSVRARAFYSGRTKRLIRSASIGSWFAAQRSRPPASVTATPRIIPCIGVISSWINQTGHNRIGRAGHGHEDVKHSRQGQAGDQ